MTCSCGSDLTFTACRPIPAKQGRVLLVPWGTVERYDDTSFVVDDDAARLILERFEWQGRSVDIDYEHAVLGGEWKSPDGLAPAAGWIDRLEAIPGQGIFGSVTWTERAAKLIGCGEYRYLSPVLLIDDDRRAVEFHSAGLTNDPAIRRAQALVNSRAVRREGATGRRESIIRRGLAEHAAESSRRFVTCTRTAWVNHELRSAGLSPLSEGDLKGFRIAF